MQLSLEQDDVGNVDNDELFLQKSFS